MLRVPVQDASPWAGRQRWLRPRREQLRAAPTLLGAHDQPGPGARGPCPRSITPPAPLCTPRPPSSPPTPLLDDSHGDKADPDRLFPPLPSPQPPIFHLGSAWLPPTLARLPQRAPASPAHPAPRTPRRGAEQRHVPKMPRETPVLSHLSGRGGNKGETLQILMQLRLSLGSRPRRGRIQQPNRAPAGAPLPLGTPAVHGDRGQMGRLAGKLYLG